jgi:hypothetical protein
VDQQDGERKREGCKLQISMLHQWAMESQTSYLSKGQNMLNKKQDYMMIGGRLNKKNIICLPSTSGSIDRHMKKNLVKQELLIVKVETLI